MRVTAAEYRAMLNGKSGDVRELSFMMTLPPSLNNAFVNANGNRGSNSRIKSKSYRAWIDRVQPVLAAVAGRITGPFDLALSLPATMRGDIDNRIKPVLDALVRDGIVDDDRHCQSIFVHRTPLLEINVCTVCIRAAQPTFDAPSSRVGGPKPLPDDLPRSAGAEAIP